VVRDSGEEKLGSEISPVPDRLFTGLWMRVADGWMLRTPDDAGVAGGVFVHT
jgi:hypothetical protein